MVGNLGFYKFTHMLFGLCNAPLMFQHLMQNTLGKLNLTYCMIYLDNIIVFGRMDEEHLCMVFERFQEFNLKLKPLKCSFFQSEIVYLAHHISQRGILPSWENVWAVQEFLNPETYMQVCAFCRLVGHYRRFIKGFTNIAHPLYDMVGKEVKMGPVDLPSEAWEAMDILKERSSPHLSWCSLILTSLSCWRQMPPRKDWARCSPRNRVMDGTIPSPLGAAP